MKALYLLLIIFKSLVIVNLFQFDIDLQRENSNTITFKASEKYLDRIKENSIDHYQEVKERYWVLRGDTIRYDQLEKEFEIAKKSIDTIFFWENLNDQNSDTILCFMNVAGSYEFVYNSCCGGFSVLNSNSNQFTSTQINFQLTEDSNHPYLGRVDGIGRMIEVLDSVIMPITCRSAMSPNIYDVVIEKINEEVSTDNEEIDLVCYYKGQNYPDSLEYQYYFNYSLIRREVEFKYMPLDYTILKVKYNPVNSKCELQTKEL